jgi:hypothetical protein
MLTILFPTFLPDFEDAETFNAFGVPGTYLHQKLWLPQLFSSNYPFVCS